MSRNRMAASIKFFLPVQSFIAGLHGHLYGRRLVLLPSIAAKLASLLGFSLEARICERVLPCSYFLRQDKYL
jgi:hypothetical protein